jgi:hypothetical protein
MISPRNFEKENDRVWCETTWLLRLERRKKNKINKNGNASPNNFFFPTTSGF